jgi:hypothetical protein
MSQSDWGTSLKLWRPVPRVDAWPPVPGRCFCRHGVVEIQLLSQSDQVKSSGVGGLVLGWMLGHRSSGGCFAVTTAEHKKYS